MLCTHNYESFFSAKVPMKIGTFSLRRRDFRNSTSCDAVFRANSKHNFVWLVADSICVDMVRHHADVVGDMVVGDDDCGVSSAVFDFVFLGGVSGRIFAQKVLDALTDMKVRF